MDSAVYPPVPSYQSTPPAELAGPWRRAALVAVGIAGIELIVLIVLVGALVAQPLAHRLHRQHAEAQVAAAPARPAHASAPAARAHATRPPEHAGPVLARSRTRVLVLNGNGRTGAAGAEAAALQGRGYRISATGNAGRTDYATSIVMYRPGFEREARRLARDEGIRVVATLDGLRVSDLKGAQLALVVGN